MHTLVRIDIESTPSKIWKVITDIENSVTTIRGIQKIEVLEKPESGLTGFKWRETRTMFGKEATEVMWITGAEENRSYSVRAESHGSVYLTDFRIEEEDGAVMLTTEFRSEPQSFGAKLMNGLFGKMMRKATAAAFLEDLEDIKKAVESAG